MPLFHRRVPYLEKQRGDARIERRSFQQPDDLAIERMPQEHRDRIVQPPGDDRSDKGQAGLSGPMADP